MMTGFYILTTTGPVRIQSITREDPAIRSVVCVDGRARALPISPEYDAFVRNPTGVIEAATGHAGFRVDVDGEVDDGLSWQLPLYLAHVCEDLDRDMPVKVFATGEVDRNLNVRPVAHIDRKLQTLSAFLDAEGLDFDSVTVIVPAGSELVSTDRLTVTPVSTVKDALKALGAQPRQDVIGQSVPRAPASNPGIVRSSSVFTASRLISVALVVLMIAFVSAGLAVRPFANLAGQGEALALEEALDAAKQGRLDQMLTAQIFESWLTTRRPDLSSLRSEVSSISVEIGEDCGSDERVVTSAGADIVPLGPVPCTVEWRGFVDDGDVLLIGRLGYWREAADDRARPDRVLSGSDRTDGRLWSLELEEPVAEGAALRLVAILGRIGMQGAQPWYRDLLEAPQDSLRLDAARRRVERLGYAVSVMERPLRMTRQE